jgi:hypothetical protein
MLAGQTIERVHIVTICLDAIRFLPSQFVMCNRLRVDWQWSIAEGVADNVQDTSWCKKIPPRLSQDGTTEFLGSIKQHQRVHIYQKPLWPGKVSMMNAMLDDIKKPCILLQIDADEFWLPDQIELILQLFQSDPKIQCARFKCRYFVGPNLVTVGDDCYGNNPGEWLRAWKFIPGQRFRTHEPPVLNGCMDTHETILSRDFTRDYDLVFDHYAYAYPEQLAFKEKYYGYSNALEHWKRLQAYDGQFPTKLKPFLPWVDDRVQVEKFG